MHGNIRPSSILLDRCPPPSIILKQDRKLQTLCDSLCGSQGNVCVTDIMVLGNEVCTPTTKPLLAFTTAHQSYLSCVQVPHTLSFSFLPAEHAQMERTKCAAPMQPASQSVLTCPRRCCCRYHCPDRLDGQKGNSSTDIWSLGMSLLEIHLGHYV